ncbi:MAG: DUF3343 domain-containing protein [Clostridiales bacterium]|nr:DUF3343 domain-containing protein [Clostridiales bacterium]
MRKKELRSVVAFDTTTDAFAMEHAGRESGLLGRLIPVPLQITAGCGLAWSEPADNRTELEKVLKEKVLRYTLCKELVI